MLRLRSATRASVRGPDATPTTSLHPQPRRPLQRHLFEDVERVDSVVVRVSTYGDVQGCLSAAVSRVYVETDPCDLVEGRTFAHEGAICVNRAIEMRPILESEASSAHRHRRAGARAWSLPLWS